MVWIRTVIFDVSFNCCYDGTPQLDRPAIKEDNEYRKRYKSRDDMRESLVIWADKVAKVQGERIADESCQELRFDEDSQCSVHVTTIGTNEEHIIDPRILEQIRTLETYIEESRDNINRMKGQIKTREGYIRTAEGAIDRLRDKGDETGVERQQSAIESHRSEIERLNTGIEAEKQFIRESENKIEKIKIEEGI